MSSVKDILRSKDVVSLEERYDDIMLLNNISTESLANFFKEFGARSVDVVGAVLPSFSDRAYKDSVRHSMLVKTKMREFDNTDLAAITIVVPDGFSGNFPILIDDIITSYDSVVEGTKDLMLSIIRDIADNINVSDQGIINPPSSIVKAKEIRFKRETYQKGLASLFQNKKAKSFSKVIDHYRSPQEVIEVFGQLSSLERTLGKTSVDEVIKLANSLTKEINIYISLMRDKEVDRKSERSFKELTESVYEAAKCLEFIGYLQAISLQVYRSMSSLGEKVSQYKK